MRVLSAFLFCLTVSSISIGAFADETEGSTEGLKTLAVQNRQHSMKHEFSAFIGLLPLDAFKKGLTFTGAYSLHFSDAIAWEVGQFTYSQAIETELNDELENLPQPSAPTEFEVVKYFLTSNLVFKPLYGKLAVLNKALIFGEVYLVAGGGYGWMTITKRPVADFGAGTRIYVNSHFSLRIDVRDYMFISKDDLQSELWVALGACLSFN